MMNIDERSPVKNKCKREYKIGTILVRLFVSINCRPAYLLHHLQEMRMVKMKNISFSGQCVYSCALYQLLHLIDRELKNQNKVE